MNECQAKFKIRYPCNNFSNCKNITYLVLVSLRVSSREQSKTNWGLGLVTGPP